MDPSVTTPNVVAGATGAVKSVLFMPPAKAITQRIGLREICFPQGSLGTSHNLFEVGSYAGTSSSVIPGQVVRGRTFDEVVRNSRRGGG